MDDKRNLFGIAVTTAYIKALAKSSTKARLMCEAFAIGFGISETDGDEIFAFFRSEGHPEIAGGAFLSTPYSTYEQQVRDVYDNYYSTASASNFDKEILTSASHAMIFAYTLNSSINLYDFQKLLGNVLSNVCTKVLETSYFTSEKDSENTNVVITPFLNRTVLTPFLQHDYSQTLRYINATAKDVETPITNYNWYDVSSILQGPNLQIMKDVESQYYYLSGRMVYQSAVDTLEPCIEDWVTVPSWSGDVSFSYVRNVPCRDSESYIGPVNYTVFNRIFNDGPPSSGHFSGSMLEFYSGNDKTKLTPRDYRNNYHQLRTYTGASPLSYVQVDGAGNYSLSNGDYLNAPKTFECDIPLQRMHIGDNQPRYICNTAKDCVCPLQTLTGFKFAGVELPDELWTSDLQFRQTNPISEQSRMLKRVWSITDNPYLATDEGGVLMPYIQDSNPPYTKYWYVGYPQLNGVNGLPNLAFFQSFENRTFEETARVTMYPSIGTSVGGGNEYDDSQRTYDISSMQLFSGAGTLPIQFNIDISSNLSGKDDVAQKFFGMGNAFSGKYNISLSAEENAGFFYTGFAVYLDGQLINATTLADTFSESTLGKYKTIKYISGYKNVTDGSIVPLTNFLGKNSTGDTFTYQFVSQSDSPFAIVSQDNWSWFANVPTTIETQCERIFESQTVESYFPRYYDGPFSRETRKFLYPNAKAGTVHYQSKLYGFPTGISLKVEVREEAVREVFGKYTIYTDGSISSSPESVEVIRSDIMNAGTRKTNPIMFHMFYPNRPQDRFDYNFNYWSKTDEFSTSSSLEQLVDNNWAPMEGKYVPLGRNSNVFKDNFLAEQAIELGVKKRRQLTLQTHILYTNGGAESTEVYSENPRADGLFHAFTYNTMDCTLAYVPPIFDLSLNTMVVTDAMKVAFPLSEQFAQREFYHYRGNADVLDTGKDPLFFEVIGGRRGTTAAQEGGYHSKGLIGDRWMGNAYIDYGEIEYHCYEGVYTYYHLIRAPGYDNHLLVFNTSFSGTDLWTNGFNYSPYVVNRIREPMPETTKCYYQHDGGEGEIPLIWSGGFLNFRVDNFFPLIIRTGDALSEEWYYKSGFKIGPFDRDVEICLSKAETLCSYSDFYINNQRLSHWFSYASDCEKDWAVSVGLDRVLQPAGPNYSSNVRNPNLTILAVVPSGERANLNVFSVIDPDTSMVPVGHASRTLKGIVSGVTLSLRTHVPLDGDDYIDNWDSGEYERLKSYNHVNNGIPKVFHIEHKNGPENLAGIHEFVTYGYSGKLYPRPDDEEFAKRAVKDSDGNLIYGPDDTPENYWKEWAIKNRQKVYFSGYREGSRVSFKISNVQLAYDKVPYQSYNLVVPSGDCFLSGEMGYYAQADNCIFTEGFHLTNATIDDVLAESYNPSFVSEVLRRVPSELFKFPVTLSGTAPVLQAPSVMKSREFESGIYEGQTYYYFLKEPPYNYNKLLWPALSDLETLNPGETMESIAPGDGQTFTNSTMLFSASQGQPLPNGIANPDISKRYYVQDIFQMYDSVTTDSMLNNGRCLTSGRGTSVLLTQNNMSGALVPRGSCLSLVLQGLV